MNQIPMLIQPYNPKWTIDFLNIKEIIDENIDYVNIEIEHIGSTSIPGLAAKNIIDIDIIYFDEDQFHQVVSGLNLIGYKHVGDQGIVGREVFKREPSKEPHKVLDKIRHHLYVCHFQNVELKRHLLFRDYLRTHEKERNEYQKLKLKIAEMSGQDRKEYARMKENIAKDFVERVISYASRK